MATTTPAPDAIGAALDRGFREAEDAVDRDRMATYAEAGVAYADLRAQLAEERAERDKLARLVQLANLWSDAPTSSRRCRNYNAARFAQAGA